MVFTFSACRVFLAISFILLHTIVEHLLRHSPMVMSHWISFDTTNKTHSLFVLQNCNTDVRKLILLVHQLFCVYSWVTGGGVITDQCAQFGPASPGVAVG